MDYVRVQRFFMKAMDLVEDESKPTTASRVHKVLLLLWRFTMYTGVSLQDVALFAAGTPRVKLRRPFIALTISKILIKGTVFLLQKRGVTEMWRQLDDQAIKTKNIAEVRYETGFCLVGTILVIPVLYGDSDSSIFSNFRYIDTSKMPGSILAS